MPNDKVIRVIDLFGGIGGFRIGLENANKKNRFVKGEQSTEMADNRFIGNKSKSAKRGRRWCNKHQCFDFIWYCDKDKYAVQTYNKNFKEEYEPTDATTVDVKDIPDFDLLCAGFPCQSFSIAGKRKGFQDIRGTMFYEVCRIAQEKRPRLLFLENVKGLLSADDGRCFATILSSLSELGYSVEWQVLNSKNFGVPQNRERVFIIGHLGEGSGQQVFPFREPDEIFDEWDSERKIASALQSPGHACGNYRGMNMIRREQFDVSGKGYNSQQDRVYHTDGVMCCLPNAHPDNKLNIMVEVHTLQPRTGNSKQGGTGHLSRKDGYSYCLDGGNSQAIEVVSRGKHQQDIIYSENGIIASLPGGTHGSTKHLTKTKLNNGMIRRLTPIECERLQGFHDGWTDGVSDTQRYKQLGNAVTVNVIESIGRKIIECLNAV